MYLQKTKSQKKRTIKQKHIIIIKTIIKIKIYKNDCKKIQGQKNIVCKIQKTKHEITDTTETT